MAHGPMLCSTSNTTDWIMSSLPPKEPSPLSNLHAPTDDDVEEKSPPTKKPKEDNKKALKQPNIFSLRNYPITEKKLNNQNKVIASFIRRENVGVAKDAGVFKVSCPHCKRSFLTSQGLGNHLPNILVY